ncbi:MAG TPA: DUF1659 domain-containing protein [Bacillota bacterium]|nr:DUF1659 domain-containing protein [Bacillota bacterium]
MALEVNPLSSRLQLQLDYGVNEDGRPITRTKSYSNIKPEADNESVYNTAQALAGLQSRTLIVVRRIEQSELVEA